MEELLTHECGYCLMDVTQDEGVWVDKTGGDCCSGNDSTLVNENGTHEVFSPVEGYDSVCLSYIEHDEDFCALCFHSEDEHTQQQA